MKKRKLLCLVLAALITGSTVIGVGAARFLGDVNNDGKVSVFDAQMLSEEALGLRTLSEEQDAAAGSSTISTILAQIWGDVAAPDDADKDGAFDLSTVDELLYMSRHPGAAYELVGDIDLDGAVWTPIKSFTGSLNGNGYTISNCVIGESVDDISKTNGMYDQNMGFFGDIEKTGSVTNLKLRDITVNADDDAGYIGILVGTSRGNVSGVNVSGTINDDRTDLNGGKIYVGTIAGKIAGSSVGTISCDATMSVTDDLNLYTTKNLSSIVAMHVQKTSPNVVIGLVGWAPTNKTVTGNWCDSANDSAQLSQTLQDRQQVVVDYMDAMATVAWQVSEPITYYAKEGGNVVQSFYPGVTYYGLPYTSMNGSLERFMTQFDTSSGSNITIPGLQSSTWDNTTGGYNGFAQYMGNDCSAAVGWAWLRVSPIRVKNGENETTAGYSGGVYPRYAVHMVPNSEAQIDRGIYPVGDWTTVSNTDDTVVGTFAYTVADGLHDTCTAYDFIGRTTLLEAYAVSRKADAIIYENYDEVTKTGGGHVRLLVADPIVIRGHNGSIRADQSYVLCTEQGDGLAERDQTNSSWRYHYKYNFSELINTRTPKVYLPITIRALRSDYVRNAYISQYSDKPVTGPASGKLYSNFRIVSSTVTVADSRGNEIYNKEIFTGVSNSAGVARDTHQVLDLFQVHGESFLEAAQAANMGVGKQYRYTVKILLSNGETRTIVNNAVFRYTVPTE